MELEILALRKELRELESQGKVLFNQVNKLTKRLEQLEQQTATKTFLKDQPIYDQPQHPKNIPPQMISDKYSPETNSQQETIRHEINSSVIEQAGIQWGTALLGPFSAVTQQLKSFYQHYLDKGLGPVFLMTLAGIVTLTLGFGYLLQYSYNHWLSDVGKVLTGFLFANGVLLTGFWICRKKADMFDYGSGLVGLSLILNYLCGYFLGPYYGLITPLFSLLLLLSISCAGYWLSQVLATRIVAVITLLGGSASPLILGDNALTPQLYFPYLLLLAGYTWFVSRKLNWPSMLVLAGLTHIGVIELYIVFQEQYLTSQNFLDTIALICLQVMFYLYTLSALFKLDPVKPDKLLLLLPSTQLAFIVMALIQLTDSAGIIMLFHALVFTSLFWLRAGHALFHSISLVFAGVFFGFSALLLLGDEFKGIIWSLEGLLLLWLGLRHRFISVRAEAYVLLVLGLGSIGWVTVNWLLVTDYPVFDINWASLLICCLLLRTSEYLLLTHSKTLISSEARVQKILAELVSILLVLLIFISGLILAPKLYLNLALPAMAMLLYRASKQQLKVSESLAWLMFLPLIVVMCFSALEAGNFHFMAQSLSGKLARVEVFAAMWGIGWFYASYYPSSKWQRLANGVKLSFYMLLPLIFLPKIWRSYTEFIPLALWASTFISLGLNQLVRHRFTQLESILLSFAAILVTTLFCLLHDPIGLIALTIGAVFYGSLLYFGLDRLTSALRFFYQSALYYFALVISVVSFALTDNWHIAIVIPAIYLWSSLLYWPVLPPLRGNLYLAYSLALLMPLLALMLHTVLLVMDNPAWLASLLDLSLLLLIAWGLKSKPGFAYFTYKLLGYKDLLWGWHLLLIWNYLLAASQLPANIAAPLSSILLVLHGCGLMFISLNARFSTLIKLAIAVFVVACGKILLLDMASFSLLQKVIAFMAIGGTLLLVAYLYQQSRQKLELKNMP